MNPYQKCPTYENENYTLRLVELTDAPDLLLTYSDEKAVPYFNSDNCNGDDFHYTTLERMESAISFWRSAYEQNAFVRWVIIDKHTARAMGTIELFNRQAKDFYNDCGLLRLDLHSNYETAESIQEILTLILKPAFQLFGCRMIATKIPPFALSRKTAAETLGFAASEEKLVGGDDGRVYGDYYVKYAA